MKKNYDSDFCGSLPLHQINHVQDYGCMLVVDPELNILQASENTSTHLGVPAEKLIGKQVTALLNPDSHSQIKKITNRSDLHKKQSGRITMTNGEERLAVANNHSTYSIIEIEPLQTNIESFTDSYQRIRPAIDLIESGKTAAEILSGAAESLKTLSGFDKVMIYRFDEDWNGHVVAEAKEDGMDQYLGLAFPASDIPKQARELYKKNPYRLIPNVDYTPARLYPLINQSQSGFVDMSSCNLRGVAKVHLEYLNNMGVKSSMSTRIMKDDSLWGLISCHHRQPYFLNFDECLLFELLSGIISSRLTALEIRENSEALHQLHPFQSEVLSGLYSSPTIQQGIVSRLPMIMKAMDCTGIMLTTENKIYTDGVTPNTSDAEQLLNWLQTRDLSQPYIDNQLSAHLDDAINYSDIGSGIISLPLIPDKREFLIMFRKETPSEINWGGNPNEAINFEEGGKEYHPRNSFRIWQESVRNSAVPFTSAQIRFARDLQNTILSRYLNAFNSN
jgi:light-regulated signal transduction histidine kinase (bacteriophytochrome)